MTQVERTFIVTSALTFTANNALVYLKVVALRVIQYDLT